MNDKWTNRVLLLIILLISAAFLKWVVWDSGFVLKEDPEPEPRGEYVQSYLEISDMEIERSRVGGQYPIEWTSSTMEKELYSVAHFYDSLLIKFSVEGEWQLKVDLEGRVFVPNKEKPIYIIPVLRGEGG